MAMSISKDLPWELIIVDNNSTDNTKEIVEEYKIKSGLDVVYVFEEKRGLANARNSGIREAKGEIIAFIDDDVIVDRNWLVNLHKAFEIYNPAVMGGKVLIQGELPVPKWFSKNISDPLGVFDRGDNIIIADSQYNGLVGIGANMSFKREIFDKFGFFKTDLGRKGNKLCMGEETELYWRIKNHGEKCIYYPFAIIYHCIDSKRMSKSYVRRWFFRIGEWYCFSDMFLRKDTSKKIFGIPGRKYKRAFKDLLGLFWYTLRNSQAKAFCREVSIISFLGYCVKRVKVILPIGKYNHQHLK
jgi:glycosyltransferase involved in cell wall biosynthesis